MKISIEVKQTYVTIAELVEGEAFIHRDAQGNESIYIYAFDDEVADEILLLHVAEYGLIPHSFSKGRVSDWRVDPLEITGISLAPSTCRDR